jgi:CelD/BcsL family acetyltransferase involved in cellulose biosynthesis
MHAPLTPKPWVEWRDFAALEAVSEEWRQLVSRAIEPNVFYEPSFALRAAPVFGGSGAVLVWSARGRLVGLFPMHRTGMPAALAGWTHPYAPLGVPLVDRDEPEAVIAAWLDHLAADAAAPARLLLPLIPEQGPFATALDAVLTRSGRRSAAFNRHERALLAPGSQRAGYLDRAISTDRRKELRRQRRRLYDIAPVTFEHAGADNIAAALNDFLVIEASGWKGLAGTAAVNDDRVRGFVESAVTALATEGKAQVARLCLNGRAIAAGITLQSGGTTWWWKVAYSEGLARFSPGVQLSLDLTEALLADPKIARVDSCAVAGHPMIDNIWRERLAISDRLIELKRSLLPFGFACLLERLRRSGIGVVKRLRDRLRPRRSSHRPQQAADHLAGGGHGQLFDKSNLTRIFMRGEPRPYEILDVGGERV